MKKSEYKSLWCFEPFDYRASETWLNRLALQGKKLESISGYTASFSACEPEPRVYRVGIYEEDLSESGQKKRQTYINRWTGAGWEFCAQSDYLYYFCRKGTDDTLPGGIRPREDLLLRIAVWRREFYAVFIMLLVLAFGRICQLRMTYRSFLTYTDFCKTSIFVVFVIPSVFILLYHVFFCLRGRAMIRRGRLLSVPTVAAARFRSVLIYSVTVLFLLYVVCALAADALTGYPRMALTILPLLLAVGVVLLVRKLRAKGKKHVLITGILVILAVTTGLAFLSAVNLDNASNELPADSYALHASDLDPPQKIQKASYVHSQSPLIRRHYVYVETAEDGTKLSTEYISCIGPKTADLMFELVTRELSEMEPGTYSVRREGNDIIYCEPAADQ